MARSSDMQTNRNEGVKKGEKGFLNFYGVPEKVKLDRRSAFISKEYKLICKIGNIEKEYTPLRLNNATGVVEREIQTLKNLIIANLQVKIG